MAQVYAKSPQTGREYLVEISGETPTPSEEQRIIEYIGRQEGTYAPTFDEDLIPTDKGSGTISNVAKGFGSGFLTSLANVPEGLTTFGETIAQPFGYDPDSNQFGETAESITDYLTGKIDTYVGRPDEDSVAGKIGQTFGSLGSFIVPATLAAKGVSLLGGGIKAVRAAGLGTGTTLGVGLGSKEQIDRVSQKIESGQEIPDNDKDAAIILGGIIGSTEAIPLGRFLDPLVKIFKKVPRDKADDAAATIKGTLKRIGGTALAEGGQEALASIAQDLVAKNIYDPDLSLSDSLYGSAEEGIYGGGAAGVLDLLIGGRRKSSLSKLEKQFNELTEDQKQEAIEAEPKVQRAIQSLMGQINSDDGLLLLEDKTKLSEAIKREGLKPSEEKLVAQRLFDEIQRGNKVKTRPDLLKQIEDLAKQNAVGNANTSFRTARGSKYYVQDDGTTIRNKKKKSAKDPDQTSGIQDKSIKTIYLNQKELDSLYSKTKGLQEFKGIELTPSGFLIQDLSKPLYSLSDSRDIVKAEVKSSKVNEPKKGSFPVELFQRNGKMSIHVGNKITSVQPKPKSPYKLNQELNEIRKLESERQSAFSQLQGVESNIANFNQEENATTEKFREYENLRNELNDKITGINTRLKPKIAQFNTRYAKDLNVKQKPLSFDNLQAEANESRIASDQATKSEFTQEYQRTQQAVANSFRKKLKDLGLVDVELVTKNVITPDEVLDIDGKTISPTDKKSSSELFRKFGLPEGFEMEGTEGKRIITLAMELYDPKLSAQELEAKIGSVLNHEIIHSIRALGLFKKEEWNALTKAAATRKYVRIINGKPTARSYSYLDRAQVMYGNQKNMTMDAIQEEAVAEMFRDYSDGKIAMAGKPKSLFKRIYNFIRGIAESHYDADFKEASDIFELIRTKSDRQIGRRQRVPISRTDARASIASFNRPKRIKNPDGSFRLGAYEYKGNIIEQMRVEDGGGGQWNITPMGEEFATDAANTLRDAIAMIDESPSLTQEFEESQRDLFGKGAKSSIIKPTRTFQIKFYHSAKDIGEYGKRSRPRRSILSTEEIEATSLEEAKQKLRQLPSFNNSIKEVERMLGSFAITSTTPRLIINDVKEVGVPSDVYDSFTDNERLYIDGLITLNELNQRQPDNKFLNKQNIKSSLIKGIDYEGNKKSLDIKYDYIKPTKEFYNQLSIEDIAKLSDTNLENLFRIDDVLDLDPNVPKDKELITQFDIRRKKYSNRFKTIQSIIDENPEGVADDAFDNATLTLIENPEQYGIINYGDPNLSNDPRNSLAYKEAYLSSFDTIFDSAGLREKGYSYDYSNIPKAAILAFHGSPFNFEQFLTSKIGSGEGAQAFGYGLYFTDSEGIAATYAYPLRNTINVNYKGELIDSSYRRLKGSESRAIENTMYTNARFVDGLNQNFVKDFMSTYDAKLDVLSEIRDRLDNPFQRLKKPKEAIVEAIDKAEKELAKQMEGAEFIDNLKRLEGYKRKSGLAFKHPKILVLKENIKELKKLDPNDFTKETIGDPRVYKVKLDTAEENLMDYDKPIGSQSETVFNGMVEFTNDVFENPQYYNVDLQNMVANLGYELNYDSDAVQKAKNVLLGTSGTNFSSSSISNFLNSFEIATGKVGFAEKNLYAFDVEGIMFDSGNTRGKPQGKMYLIKEKDTPSYGQDSFVDIDDNPVRFIKSYLKNPMILIANNKDSIDLPLTMQNVRDLNYEDISIRDRIQNSLYNQSSQIKITDGKPISIREALNNFVKQETDKVISNLEEDNRNISPRFRKSDPDKKTLPESKIDEAKQDLNSFLNLTNEDLKIEQHKVEHNYVIFDDAVIKIEGKRKYNEEFIEERNETNPIADKDSEVSLSEALNDEQNKELESTREELKNFPKASLVATSPFSMVRSPVRNPKYPNIDDPRNYEYGYIYTQGSTRFKEGVPVAPILLTTGKDDAKLFNVTKDEEPTRYVQPFGLKNIENNNFNGLLFENSKYTSVERAIYDMLRKWQDQGYKSGDVVESVSGYDGAGFNQPVSRIELLYKRPPRKSVPLKLNLLRAKTPENNTVWIVESLEPQIETKKRKASVSTVSPSVINASMLGQIQQRNTAIMYGGAAKTLSRILEVPLKLFYTDAEQKSKRVVDRFLINFQDSMLPVGQLLDDLRKNGLNISDGMDTYLQEELYHGIVGDRINTNEANLYRPLSSAIKNINLTEGQIDQLKNTSTFARDYIDNAKVPNLSIADIYLYALHAKERNDYILQNRDRTNDSGSGMTNQEADAILNWVNNLQPEQSLVFRDISNKAQDIIKSTNQVRFEGGLIPDFNQETTDSDGLPLPSYTNYVPLRGKFDIENDAVEESEPQIRITRARFGASGREDRRALGRDAENYGKDIVASLMMQNQNAIIRAERNKVGQSFLDLLESNPDETADVGFISETRPLRRGVSSTGYVRMMPDLLAQQDKNTFIVKRDGKEFYIKLYDDRIAQALKGTMNPSHANGLVKAMGKVSRWLSNVNTTYNPEFVVTNVIRDLQTAGVNVQQYNKDGVNQLASKIISTTPKAWSGIKQALDLKIPLTNNDPNSEWALIYKDFVANGGQNAINQMGDLQDQINSIDKVVSDIGTNQGTLGKGLNKSKKLFSQLGSFLENVNTTAENGVRVATYKALIDSGMSKARAAQAARNVTVNFSKGGEYKSAMNALYLFYNASLQGSFALLNAAARSPRVRKFWASAVVFGVMMDQLASLLSEEDEKTGQKKHDMIKDHILESNILIPYGGTTGNDYIKIPMPYGLNMAVNLGRVFSRSMRGEYTAGEAINSGLGVMVNTLNPLSGTPKFLGGEESVWNFISPTVGDPIVDILENKDYKDSPIYKEASPFGLQQPASQRYWQSTSPLLIGASKILAQDLPSVAEALGMGQKGTTVLPGSILGFETEVSPDVIQFWLEYATGGLGRFTLKALELPSITIPKILEEGYSLPAISKGISENLRSIPFASRVSGSLGSFEDTGSFIEGRDEVLLAFKELQEARKAQDETRYNRTLEKFAPQLTIVGKIKAINNARNRLIRKRNEIRKNPRVSQERKDLLITRINGKIEELTVTGNRVMREANVI